MGAGVGGKASRGNGGDRESGREARMGGRGGGHMTTPTRDLVLSHRAVRRGAGVTGSPRKRGPVGRFSLKPEHGGKPKMTPSGRTPCPSQQTRRSHSLVGLGSGGHFGSP